MPAAFVPFTVTVCGIAELVDHGDRGVTHVLSILDPEEPEPAAFGGYGEHRRLELRFHDIIKERDGEVLPTARDVEAILAFGRDLMAEPAGVGHLVVHCHMGISRSTAALTMLLVQAAPHLPDFQAMAAVAGIRAQAWPNSLMIEHADRQLNRGGKLVEAVRARHRQYGLGHPEIVRFMRENGREREVDWS